MKILITGATGFAGGYLLRYLSNIYGIENVHGITPIINQI